MQNDGSAAQKPIDQFKFGFLHPVAKIFYNTTIQNKLFYKKMNFMPKALWWPTVRWSSKRVSKMLVMNWFDSNQLEDECWRWNYEYKFRKKKLEIFRITDAEKRILTSRKLMSDKVHSEIHTINFPSFCRAIIWSTSASTSVPRIILSFHTQQIYYHLPTQQIRVISQFPDKSSIIYYQSVQWLIVRAVFTGRK